MKKRYKNPPIEEAVVEFLFVPGQEWDLTIPGKLHEHHEIKRQYPGKPRTQKFVTESAVQTGPGQPLKMAVREGIRIQLVDDLGQNLISLGTDVLSVNLLRPYPEDGWESFRPRIETALCAYSEVAKPIGVSRIGVRYVNKIVLPKNQIKAGIYFQHNLPSGTGLPNTVAGFISRVEYAYDDSIKLILTQATVESPEGQLALLLDIDVIWESTEAKGLDETIALVNDLHHREGEAFEAIITDAARQLFNQ